MMYVTEIYNDKGIVGFSNRKPTICLGVQFHGKDREEKAISMLLAQGG